MKTGDAILQPRVPSWIRLANAELALSRLTHLRDLIAAPANARAMLSRMCGHSSSEEEDDIEVMASISSADVGDPDLGISLSTFINTLVDAAVGLLSKDELKAGIKAFVAARVDEGEDRAAAHAGAKSIVEGFRTSLH